MLRPIKKTSEKAGLPPETLVYIGGKKTAETKITIIDYDEKHLLEKEVKTVEECVPFKDTPTVTWINVDNVHQTETIKKLGDYFGIHPLALEDIVNTDQHPKIDDFVNCIYFVLKKLDYDDERNEIIAEQISLILSQHFAISFQEKESDVFNPVRERIRSEKSRIRKMKNDYLVYALIDVIVDSYFKILEKLGDKIESIDEELVTNPTQETLQTIHNLKKEIIFLRKSVWHLGQAISEMEKEESPLIQESTRIYFRDVCDETVQVIDRIEMLRDMASGMLDVYFSSVSNKMSEVMKVLTIIATIFIPLTFVVGIYGMNFKYMPELGLVWFYPLLLLIMFAIGISMLFYFRKKKWL
jgi:magnesium transporter